MKKYNKAAWAAAVTAVAVIVEWATSVNIPVAVQGAITTLIVFLVPNSEDTEV
jgi:hypothetical protein